MSSENSTVLKHLQEHRYFLPGGDVYFLAENQLFRVHRYFFQRESRVFQRGFQSGPRNGETESTAIILDVSPASFEKLLDVFYNERYSVYNWSIEDWTTVIKLAQKWEFPEVLELAIRELSRIDMSLIRRIAIYQHLNIDRSHLLPMYAELCRRPQALTLQESKVIGLETTVLIANVRERLRAPPANGGMSPLPVGIEDDDVKAAVIEYLGTSAPHAVDL
ncbi:hypothetical protein C0993_012801 [Termitomyces sp. T159_Od127]|nr:hypothetical protein C0993_012801 [Termitomyces sp. T159_Od127]